MSVIKSDKLTVKIDECGSSLTSFYDEVKDVELLWQGSEDSWTGQDVTIFPFVGRLKDGFYTVDGIEYHMPAHGLCRTHTFDIVGKTNNSVTHSFGWDEDTLTSYPYKFQLNVEHIVEGAKYIKKMTVKNLDVKDMYFGIGGHPAMQVPVDKDGDTEESNIVFAKKLNVENYFLDDAGHYIERRGEFGSFESFSCSKDTMKKYKTLIFTGEEFRSASLKRPDGIEVEFEFSAPPALAFWSHPDCGGYYCVEPWWGIPDFADTVRELKDKELIQKLAAGESREYIFSIEIK